MDFENFNVMESPKWVQCAFTEAEAKRAKILESVPFEVVMTEYGLTGKFHNVYIPICKTDCELNVGDTITNFTIIKMECVDYPDYLPVTRIVLNGF